MAAFVVTILTTPHVGATPLIDTHVGGMVFVGPTSPHVSSVFWNPAAGALLKGTHILALGMGRLDYTSVSRAPISSADGEPSAAGDLAFDTQSGFTLTPNGFLGIQSDLKADRVSLGLAVYQ